MQAKDFVKWNIRGSILYSIGVWTVIGSFGYMKSKGLIKGPPVVEVEVEEQENPNMQVIYHNKHMKTVIIMKENFVPPITRIYRFVMSLTGQTNAPQDGASSSNCDGDATGTRVD